MQESQPPRYIPPLIPTNKSSLPKKICENMISVASKKMESLCRTSLYKTWNANHMTSLISCAIAMKWSAPTAWFFIHVERINDTSPYFTSNRVFAIIVLGTAALRFLADFFVKKTYENNTKGALHNLLTGRVTQLETSLIQIGTLLSIWGKLRDRQYLKNSSFLTAAYMGNLGGYLAARTAKHMINCARVLLKKQNKKTDAVEQSKPPIVKQSDLRSVLAESIQQRIQKALMQAIDSCKNLPNSCRKKALRVQQAFESIIVFVKKDYKKIGVTISLAAFTARFAPSSMIGFVVSGVAHAMYRLFTPALLTGFFLQMVQNHSTPISDEKLISSAKNIGSKTGMCIASLGVIAHVVRRVTDLTKFRENAIPYVLPLITALEIGRTLASMAILGARTISKTEAAA